MVDLNLMTLTPLDVAARLKPINTLADEARFAVASMEFNGMKARITGWSFGTKLFHNECRARVRLDAGQRQVIFGEGSQRREFDAAGSSEVNYPTMLEVVPLTEEEYDRHRADMHSFRRSGGANIMDDKQVKALVAKYAHLKGKLVKATTDEAKEVVTKQIDAILAQATEVGLDLNALETAATKGTGTGNVVTMGAGGKVNVKSATKQTEAVRRATVKATAKATKAAKAAKPKAAKKLDSTYSCLCDCGTECNGMFAPGHDARVKGMLYKVERGELELGDLPASVQPLVKMAGRKATAGKDDSDYRVVQSPVKFPGRDDVKLVDRDGKPRESGKVAKPAA